MSTSGQALKGKRVLITRSIDPDKGLVNALSEQGSEVLELPLIEVKPESKPETLKDVFHEIATYEWVVFTSRNGVQHFFHFFFKAFSDIRCFGPMRIACIGQSTADALKPYHLTVDYMPEEAHAEALAKGLVSSNSLDSAKVLVVTGNLNRPALVEILEQEGHAIVDQLPVYATQSTDLSKHPQAERFRKEGADIILFASPSAVDSFSKQAKHLALAANAKRPITCSIGALTSAAMREKGIPVDVEAGESTPDGIVKALSKTA